MKTSGPTSPLAAEASDAEPSEIEWQFDALDLRPVERWLAALPTARPDVDHQTVTATAMTARRQVDRYLDTTDWHIGRAGLVLRTRKRGRSEEATLKNNRRASTEGLRRRLEITEQLDGGGIDLLGDTGPVGRRVRAVAGDRPLVQLLEIRTRRRPYSLHIDGTEVAEVALDETVIEVGGRQRPVQLRRVEVEVAAEWVERLRDLVDDLRRACGLQPASLSKFEAGLLALGMSVPSPPDLGPVELSPDSTIGEAATAVIRRHLGLLLAREPGTRLGEDIEELHDMRVATRRLRAALELFSDVLPARAEFVRNELTWLAGELGAVRDLDVQLDRMDQLTELTHGWLAEPAAGDESAPLDHLRELLLGQRFAARQQLLRALDSPRWTRLSTALTTLVRPTASRRPAASRVPAVVVLPGLITATHRAALKAARRARRSGEAADFHRLRIRAKRLRYALELTAAIYGARADRFSRKLAKLQEQLGQMQDAEVASARLLALATSDAALSPITVFTMGSVAEHYRIDAARLLERMTARLRVLDGPEWQRLSVAMERRRTESLAAPPVRRRAARALGPPPVITGLPVQDPGEPRPRPAATAAAAMAAEASEAAQNEEVASITEDPHGWAGDPADREPAGGQFTTARDPGPGLESGDPGSP